VALDLLLLARDGGCRVIVKRVGSQADVAMLGQAGARAGVPLYVQGSAVGAPRADLDRGLNPGLIPTLTPGAACPGAAREPLDRLEYQVLDQQADDDHRGQTGEHLVGIALIAALENIPAQAALAGGGAEHQFGGDQGAPCKRPADFQARQDGGEGRRYQDLQHQPHAAETVVAAGHAQRFGHGPKAGVGVQRQRPHHRMQQHDHQAGALKTGRRPRWS
jgi:hypothetical protein